MADINSVVFTGRLTRDPEVRQTQAGKSFTKFAVAVNGFKDGDVMFLDCTAFGFASDAAANLVKGSRVGLDGRLNQENWTDKETGAKRSKLAMIVNGVTYLEPRADQRHPRDESQEPRKQRQGTAAAGLVGEWDEPQEEFHF